MSREDALRGAMVQVESLVVMASLIDVGALEDGVDMSLVGDTLAPVTHPTEWMRMHVREEQLRRLIIAVLAFRKELDAIFK